jgi:hypothetical protein
MKKLFRLVDSGEGMHGTDAIDENGNKVELKSGKRKSGFSSTRNLSTITTTKWRKSHWIFGHGVMQHGMFHFQRFWYVSPNKMSLWLDEIEGILAMRQNMADEMYNQYVATRNFTACEMRHLNQIIKRGVNLNDPIFKMPFILEHGVELYEPYDQSFREALDFSIIEKCDHIHKPATLEGFFNA